MSYKDRTYESLDFDKASRNKEISLCVYIINIVSESAKKQYYYLPKNYKGT